MQALENQKSFATIRLKQSSTQTVGCITRLYGLMPARFIIDLIDLLDLDANPRDSKAGAVTEAIQRSIEEDYSSEFPLFPFKSKGILLASSYYQKLDRNRYALQFNDHEVEGILDGGHNTLAIGIYILKAVQAYCKLPKLKQSDYKNWGAFKQTWKDWRAYIADYLAACKPNQENEEESALSFLIPTEVLVPSNVEDEASVSQFHSSLLEICDARNNNVQLEDGTKANKEGLFDTFKNLFEKQDPTLADTISWKTNDGGSIPARTLVALSWIPLSLTSYVDSASEQFILEAPAPVTIYSGKQKCLDKYLELMRSETISKDINGHREIKSMEITSALEIATELPELFDEIYQRFPKCYVGSYGNIGAVKSLSKRTGCLTPFHGEKADKPVPDGFIYPLVYGLVALMRRNAETSKIEWVHDPHDFIESKEFELSAAEYSSAIQAADYNPQKIGKSGNSYSSVKNSYQIAMLKLQGLL